MAKTVVIAPKKKKDKKPEENIQVIPETASLELCNLVGLQGLSMAEARKRLKQ